MAGVRRSALSRCQELFFFRINSDGAVNARMRHGIRGRPGQLHGGSHPRGVQRSRPRMSAGPRATSRRSRHMRSLRHQAAWPRASPRGRGSGICPPARCPAAPLPAASEGSALSVASNRDRQVAELPRRSASTVSQRCGAADATLQITFPGPARPLSACDHLWTLPSTTPSDVCRPLPRVTCHGFQRLEAGDAFQIGGLTTSQIRASGSNAVVSDQAEGEFVRIRDDASPGRCVFRAFSAAATH